MTMDIIAIDVETTGYSPKTNRIIQIGGVALRIEDDQCRVTGVLDLVVNPGLDVTVPREVEKLTGLDRESLNYGMPTDKALLCLQQFLDIPLRFEGESRRELVAHNIRFDLRMIAAEAKRAGVEIRAPMWLECTMTNAQRRGWGKPTLADLCQRLGVPDVGGFHNAFADAVTAMACFRRMTPTLFTGVRPVGFVGYDVSRWDIWSAIDTNPEVIGVTLRNRGLVTVEAAG